MGARRFQVNGVIVACNSTTQQITQQIATDRKIARSYELSVVWFLSEMPTQQQKAR